MKTSPLLAAALLAAGVSSIAVAQVPLPGDWEKQVAAAIPEPGRAKEVAEAGRRYEARLQASLDAMKVASAEMKAVFLTQASSVKERQLNLNVFRDDRRKAAIAAVDALLEVKALVSKAEWKAIWPKGFFAAAPPSPLLAEKVRAALPSVVSDPSRLQQAQAAADSLVKAAKSDEDARRKASGNFAKLLEDYGTVRDTYIDRVNRLEETQMKADDALIGAAGELQRILNREEWDAMVGKVSEATR